MIVFRDNRLTEVRYYLRPRGWSGPVRVPEEVRKCVGFVGYRSGAGERFVGTWFAIALELEPGVLMSYAVTAKHVLVRMHDSVLGPPLLRVNLKAGNAAWIETRFDDWVYSTDEDVALIALSRHEDWDLMSLATDLALTPATIDAEGIGPGEEIFVTGMLAHGASPKKPYGAGRNVPIVRAGHIAAMRGEPVPTQSGPTDAYLVELHSMGGLSGSPVFVHLGTVRVREQTLLATETGWGVFRWMGLLHGHYDVGDADSAIDAADIASVASTNSGIGVVVPAERVLAVLDDPRFVEEREAELEEWRRKGSATLD